MHLLASILMIGLLLSACAAAVAALEAWRTSDLPAFKITLACAAPLSVLTVTLFVIAGPPDPFSRSDHVGFGPQWHCLGSSLRGSLFCVRDVERPSAGRR